ncbi:Transcriptional regulator, MarR family [Labilithrix luteola]|uniref:Transcriptional regulator, MarR family n=1 Tax=Labilithrix luteola TaxID=1391654 RepID=A0A0K1QCY8_9BACT|nr:MarR family transcriptional regulator [Labilithrix luteola]AKV03614.1 Transcriptional regulator, MarR family [Labilithrix luteola]
MARGTRAKLDLEEFIPYRLSLASNAVSILIAQSYEKLFGIKMVEWRVMAVLAEGGELTQQDLVGLTKMDKVSVSRAAQQLEKRKLLRRVQDPKDARSLRLSLTSTGMTLYKQVVPAALDFETEVLEGLTAAEVKTLKGILRRLETTATHLLERLTPDDGSNG